MWAILFLGTLGFVTGYLVYKAVFGPAGLISLAAVVGAVFLFSAWSLSGNVRGKHGVVYLVPYFSRDVGGLSTFFHGANLARNGAYLDELAVRAGLRPISAFGYRDNFFFGVSFPIPMFHHPADGLATVSGLLDILRKDPGSVQGAQGVMDDLERIEAK